MPKSVRAWKIATAQCKRMGHSSFKKGSKGAACRSRVAEGVGRSMRKRKRKK